MPPLKVKIEIALWRLRCAMFEVGKAFQAITQNPWAEPYIGNPLGGTLT